MKLKQYWWVAAILLLLMFQSNTTSYSETLSPMFAMERFADNYVDTADLNLDVKKIVQSDASLRNIVTQYGARITYESVSETSSRYTIEVMDSNHKSMVNEIKSIGDVTSYSDSAYYAGDNIDDYEELLKAEQSRYDRYLELYNEAATIEDKLLITDKMFESEQTIAYYQTYLNNIEQSVSYTTLSVSLQEDRWIDNFVTVQIMRDQIINSLNFMFTSVMWLLPWLMIIGVVHLYRKLK